ncbi:MAG: metalloregulator ArsR/SmtB family transcription factor [Candidatus Zixiibacteriota bacterium]
MIDPNLIELQSGYLKALAQPTRLKILYFLKDGEKCQCKIIPFMEEDQSNISRHLTRMRDLGILESRREGVSIYYKIRDRKLFSLLSLVDRMVKAEIRAKAKRAKILA